MDDDLRVHHRAGDHGAFTVDRGSNEPLGTLTYHRQGSVLTLVDTAIAEEIRGEGVGAALVRASLDYAEQAHLTVEVECEWAAEYLRRHPELRKA